MREQILNEIRRLAAESGGETPGVRRFEHQTGIRQSAWRGVYWARWNDAVREAGLEPNTKTKRHEEHFFFCQTGRRLLPFPKVLYGDGASHVQSARSRISEHEEYHETFRFADKRA